MLAASAVSYALPGVEFGVAGWGQAVVETWILWCLNYEDSDELSIDALG